MLSNVVYSKTNFMVHQIKHTYATNQKLSDMITSKCTTSSQQQHQCIGALIACCQGDQLVTQKAPTVL